jgi:hypothetical protein
MKLSLYLACESIIYNVFSRPINIGNFFITEITVMS